jgi:hypothetical protein
MRRRRSTASGSRTSACSAHRTPRQTSEYIEKAEERGFVVIAGAGGAATSPESLRHTILPVLGVPMESASLKGLDSLLSTVQMPGNSRGDPRDRKPGATNAALPRRGDPGQGVRSSRRKSAFAAIRRKRLEGGIEGFRVIV